MAVGRNRYWGMSLEDFCLNTQKGMVVSRHGLGTGTSHLLTQAGDPGINAQATALRKPRKQSDHSVEGREKLVTGD